MLVRVCCNLFAFVLDSLESFLDWVRICGDFLGFGLYLWGCGWDLLGLVGLDLYGLGLDLFRVAWI